MDPDTAYRNAEFIPGAEAYPQRWRAAAEAFRERMAERAELDVGYGPGDRQRLDIFRPERAERGLVVFVHGGYWKAFDRTDWSHLAAGPVALGWAVALPSYTLCPKARIAEITQEIRLSVEVAADMVAGPVRLAGHSAGGHLVARTVCHDVGLRLRDRVEKVVPISPLADLEPLMETEMNATLRIDEAEALAESPIRSPAPPMPVTVWVGADERPAFLDQARILAEAWGADHVVEPGRHHFDVIDGLTDPDSSLCHEVAR